jgi:hypothetical protein
MLDPIETLTLFTGETATLILQPTATFNPNNVADWAPAAPIRLDLRIVYQKVPVTGQATSRQAQAMFTDTPFLPPYRGYQFSQVEDSVVILTDLGTEFARIQPAKTRMRARGIDFAVNEVRPRFYLGVANGFTLELQR